MLTIKRNKIGQFTPLLESKIVNNPWVNISAAKGEFNFKTTNEKQVVMVAAGSGITPLMSMLSQHISAVKQPIYLRYISPANEHQFVNELKMLAKTHTFFTVDFMTRTEHISQPLKLLSIHDVYCCGPQSLMQSIERLSLGVGAHYYQEHFSILPNISEEAEEVLVMLNGKPFKASNQQNLLTQLEAQSAPVTRGCGIGVCHQCHCHKKSGLVKNLLTGDVSDSGEQLIQLCISQPLSNLEIAS